jgi:hypothetical protein
MRWGGDGRALISTFPPPPSPLLRAPLGRDLSRPLPLRSLPSPRALLPEHSPLRVCEIARELHLPQEVVRRAEKVALGRLRKAYEGNGRPKRQTLKAELLRHAEKKHGRPVRTRGGPIRGSAAAEQDERVRSLL